MRRRFGTALAWCMQDHHALITRPFRSLAFALAAGLRCAACAARDLCDLSLSLRDLKMLAQFSSLFSYARVMRWVSCERHDGFCMGDTRVKCRAPPCHFRGNRGDTDVHQGGKSILLALKVQPRLHPVPRAGVGQRARRRLAHELRPRASRSLRRLVLRRQRSTRAGG